MGTALLRWSVRFKGGPGAAAVLYPGGHGHLEGVAL